MNEIAYQDTLMKIKLILEKGFAAQAEVIEGIFIYEDSRQKESMARILYEYPHSQTMAAIAFDYIDQALQTVKEIMA